MRNQSFCVPGRVWLQFFFSSRRRHTRSLRDWSSDVCSSDLFAHRRSAPSRSMAWCSSPHATGRSEERRVGKECRSKGLPSYLKKNEESRYVGRGGSRVGRLKRRGIDGRGVAGVELAT